MNTEFLNTSTERTNTAFGAIIRNIDGYLMANIKDNFQINSDILSFSLNNKSEIIELNNQVIITLRHKQRLELGDKVDCVFWDFQTSTWSSFGCVRDDTESHLWHTVCKCKHLTNFAALMDVNGRESKTLVKSLLTYICSILSIISLILTINLIIKSKNHGISNTRNANLYEMRSIITSNLCICLMITNLLVVLGMDR
ncbi:unnamed protein product, partial [Oppiella nova]